MLGVQPKAKDTCQVYIIKVEDWRLCRKGVLADCSYRVELGVQECSGTNTSPGHVSPHSSSVNHIILGTCTWAPEETYHTNPVLIIQKHYTGLFTPIRYKLYRKKFYTQLSKESYYIYIWTLQHCFINTNLRAFDVLIRSIQPNRCSNLPPNLHNYILYILEELLGKGVGW